MPAKTLPLWDTAAKKEALELLAKLWPNAGTETRAKLLLEIQSGPPQHLPINYENEDERQESRDRRVFERLSVLKRSEPNDGDPELSRLLSEIQSRYPHWKLAEGEQAIFSVWSETRYGPDSQYSTDDLERASDLQLAKTLMEEKQHREGLMDLWRRFATKNPERAIAILGRLTKRRTLQQPDIWSSALWGMRDHAKDDTFRPAILNLLEIVPRTVLLESDVTRAVADLLELLADKTNVRDERYWHLFDRTLEAAEADPENAEEPTDDQWVELAINRSLGRLATAFFDSLFHYQLKVGEGIPPAQSDRLARVLGVGRSDHRLARVIAASRLPYLHAVDAAWSVQTLIPLFDWRDETEALACWQGFAWHPRVSPDLWVALKPHFIHALQPERLTRMRNGAKTLAQMLVMVGVEYPDEAPSVEQTRTVLRAMSPDLRNDALWWLWNYIAQDAGRDDAPRGERADVLWRDRIKPWLRVWPRERALLSSEASERFALIAVATDALFPDAVDFIHPLLVKGGDTLLVNQIAESKHPELHPVATLKLLDACVAVEQLWLGEEVLAVLDRIRSVAPELADEPEFRSLRDKLRQRT